VCVLVRGWLALLTILGGVHSIKQYARISVRNCSTLRPDAALAAAKGKKPPEGWPYRLVDMDHLFATALQNRFPGGAGKAELEYVPFACALDAPSSVRPTIGRFTVYPFPFDAAKLSDRGLAAFIGCDGSLEASLARDPQPLAILSVEAPMYRPTWDAAKPAVLLPAAYPLPPPSSGLSLFAVPYPSYSHWNAAEGKMVPEAPPLEQRTALAALFANTFGGKPVAAGDTRKAIGRSPLRELLGRECAAAPPDECLMQRSGHDTRDVPGASKGAARGGIGLGEITVAELMQAYQRAKFCVQPWGDGGTRKAFWDALSVGCINVVFSSTIANGTDRWFGPHDHWTIRAPLKVVSPGGGGLLPFLRSIPESVVRERHSAVMRVREKLQYSLDNGTPDGDALDIIVKELRDHFRRQRQPADASQVRGYICNPPKVRYTEPSKMYVEKMVYHAKLDGPPTPW